MLLLVPTYEVMHSTGISKENTLHALRMNHSNPQRTCDIHEKLPLNIKSLYLFVPLIDYGTNLILFILYI